MKFIKDIFEIEKSESEAPTTPHESGIFTPHSKNKMQLRSDTPTSATLKKNKQLILRTPYSKQHKMINKRISGLLRVDLLQYSRLAVDDRRN